MGKMSSGMRMLAMAKTTQGDRMMGDPEMRRRRDDRGRYMEGGDMSYMPWREPHIPPHLERPGMNDRPEMENRQPDMYRMQDARMQDARMADSEMRQMTDGKTSAGKINYNRPDGGYGNVSYFTHKADPLDRPEAKEHSMEHPRQIGFQSNNGVVDKQTIMGWVEDMEDSDGVKGGKYTWHQAQQYAANMGITGQQRQLEFYWAMNAMYSDYHHAGKKFGVDKPEFYACMAKLFLEDPDAVDGKVEAYVKHVVKHE